MNRNIAYAREIMLGRGPTYATAAKLFPEQMRHDTYVAYAFFRIPDDIVDAVHFDDEEDRNAAQKELRLWRAQWDLILSESITTTGHPVLLAMKELVDRKNIPLPVIDCFLDAMEMDTSKKVYATYEDLCRYMDGSAAAVGVIMTYIIGEKGSEIITPETINAANELGYAMQLTNFLRDISEDYHELGRVYMPMEDLAAFDITISDIANKNYPKHWDAFCRFQIKRARALYDASESAISTLNHRGQMAVKAASKLYKSYLQKIEDSNFQVHEASYKLTPLQKLFTLFIP